MKRLMILNGPNLNLLGVREPHIYGTTTLAQIKENCEKVAAQLGLALSFHWIAILEGIRALGGRVIGVNIPNTHARDEYHRNRKISHAAPAVICGLGPQGYIAAMHALPQMAKK